MFHILPYKPSKEWRIALVFGCVENSKQRLTFLFMDSDKRALQKFQFYLNDNEGNFLHLPHDQYLVEKVPVREQALPFTQHGLPVSFLIHEEERLGTLMCQIETPKTFLLIPDISESFDCYDGWKRVFMSGDSTPSDLKPLE